MIQPSAPRRQPRLLADRTGSVALEMAMVTPLIMLLLLGFYEAYMYIRTVGLVERAAVTAANTMSRQRSSLVDCSTSNDALNLGTYVEGAIKVADPVNLSNGGQVILSAVDWPTGTPAPRVAWQRSSPIPKTANVSVLGRDKQTAKLPTGLAAVITQGNDTVLVAEVFYRFKPFAMTASFWPGAPGEINISRVAYFRARTSNLGTLSPRLPPCPAALATP